ncbi:hypothetical protein VNO77_19343 [Canavalia gladiata]|uniref:Uncharacterized protein n=1 Tax=Canavalia gladiata TaxID=3824 RepID=A0AAN9LMJ2_CANGL
MAFHNYGPFFFGILCIALVLISDQLTKFGSDISGTMSWAMFSRLQQNMRFSWLSLWRLLDTLFVLL